MRELKQSTAANVMVFLASSTDHITGVASATLTITASKDGGAFASITPTPVDRGDGWYSLPLTTTHTNTLGDLALHITASGADPIDTVMRVVAIDKADAVRMGLTALPNANAEAAGGLYTRGTGAGQINQPANGAIDANLVTWRGTQPSALTFQRVEVIVGSYASGNAPLQPTTAGRTLDVTATGAAGIDWGNVENPTTTVGLSGTTVKAATDVATAVDGVPAAVLAAFRAWQHDTGVTWDGMQRRLEAYISGEATGLNGTNPKYFLKDGTTAAIDATQDVDAGSRGPVLTPEDD
jgi:hypothetical protein